MRWLRLLTGGVCGGDVTLLAPLTRFNAQGGQPALPTGAARAQQRQMAWAACLLSLSQINEKFVRQGRGEAGEEQTIKPQSQRQRVATCHRQQSLVPHNGLSAYNAQGQLLRRQGPAWGFQIIWCSCLCAAWPMVWWEELSHGVLFWGGEGGRRSFWSCKK